MTDQELIELVQQKLPEDLSAEEIEQLQHRLRESSELREVLFEQLQLEQYLGQALGRVSVSVPAIMATAAAGDTAMNRTRALLGWGLCLGVTAILLGALLFVSQRAPQIARPAGELLEGQLPQVAELGQSLDVAGGTINASRSDSAGVQAATDAAGTGGLDGDQATADQSRPTAKAGVPGSAALGAGSGDASSQRANEPAAGDAPVAESSGAATAAETAVRAAQPNVRAAAQQELPAAAPEVVLDEAALARWPEFARNQGRPYPVAEWAFRDFRPNPGLSAQELKRWLTPVSGYGHRFEESQRTSVVTSFEGLLKLRAPWPADAVLRIAPFNHNGFVMYFWSGDEGISLHYYLYPRPAWAAYRITRRNGEPRPISYGLVGTDSDRYFRSTPGPVDIRHQAGMLVLSRGDIRLITAPLAAPPRDVYFDRQAWFSDFTMFRGEPLPDETLAAGRNVLSSESPARLKWSAVRAGSAEPADIAPSALIKLDHGGVQLSAEQYTGKNPAHISTAVKLPTPGLYELIFEVETPAVGTGVFLADDTGRQLCRLGFSRDRRTGWRTFGLLPAGTDVTLVDSDISTKIAPLAADRQWLRLVVGAGTVKCWTSGDGRHWSRACDPLYNLQGPYTQVGLFCQPSDKEPRSISLRTMQVRELPAFAELSGAKLTAAVPDEVQRGDLHFGVWLARVTESQPRFADPIEWRQRCALATLATVPPARFGNTLIRGLVADVLEQNPPLEMRIRMLRQAAELADTWEQQPETYRLTQEYEKLGRQLQDAGDPQAFAIMSRELMRAPVWSTVLFEVMPEPLARQELLQLIYSEQWPAALALCDRLRFYSQNSEPDQRWPDHRHHLRNLVDWAEATAARGQSEKSRTIDRKLHQLAGQWKHPFITELSKEAFNTLAEVQVALSEESYADACQIISSVKPDLALGLLPDPRDSGLLLSLPQMVAVAMRDYPALRQTMVDQFGRLGELRVRQAISEANVLALRATTVQFYGSEAAASAHLWLGDRAMARGEFSRAFEEYSRGVGCATPAQQKALAARLRLATAMLGRSYGSPVTEPVHFNDLTLDPAAFEQLVLEMHQHTTSSNATAALLPAAAPALSGTPKFARYTATVRGRWQGGVGNNPGHPRTPDIDWVARQLGLTQVGQQLYVNNRFQVAAIDLQSGQQQWVQALAGEQGEAHRLPLLPMKPLVTGERVFVRRLNKRGPELAALNRQNGNVLWIAQSADPIVSDPLLIQEELFVLTTSTARQNTLRLDLTSLNPLTGTVVSQTPLIQLQDRWDGQLPCQVVGTGGRLVASVGGTVLCCDLSGQLLWVRRQTWIPFSQDPNAYDQERAPPLISDGRIFVQQPGVLGLECLDVDSGRRIWQRVLPQSRRIVGTAGGRVIVETAQGFLCLSAETGATEWQHSASGILAAQWLTDEGHLLYARREGWSGSADTSIPVLVWIDGASGQPQGVWPLTALSDKEPLLGPFVLHQDRLWTFFGRGLKDATRDLVELVPDTAAPYPSGLVRVPLTRWIELQTPPETLEAAARILPGWTCLTGGVDSKVGLLAEFQGQKDVFVSWATNDTPVTLLREITLPADKKARLAIVAGHEPQEKWAIDIRVGERSLQTQSLEASNTLNGWKQWSVDLSEYAGQTIRLIVEQQHHGKPAHGYWKQLDVIVE